MWAWLVSRPRDIATYATASGTASNDGVGGVCGDALGGVQDDAGVAGEAFGANPIGVGIHAQEAPAVAVADLIHCVSPVLSGPKVVSDRIGHANVGFFLQTYAHVLVDDDREAAQQRRRS